MYAPSGISDEAESESAIILEIVPEGANCFSRAAMGIDDLANANHPPFKPRTLEHSHQRLVGRTVDMQHDNPPIRHQSPCHQASRVIEVAESGVEYHMR